MKRSTILFTIFAMGLCACVKDRVVEPSIPPVVEPGARQLIHYWSFNGNNLLAPDTSIGGAAIDVAGTFDAATPGSLLNARRGEDTGSALRVRNPSTTMIIKVPTTGYKSPLVSFALMRTDSGPQENIISYTLDGTNYITSGITPNVVPVNTSWSKVSFDFAAIAGANNNANFALKITFNIGNTGSTGNDRYDNVSVDALKDTTGTPPITPSGDSLIHYWDFNANTSNMAVFTQPTYTRSQAALTYAGNYQDTVQEGSTINVRNGSVAGNALRLRNPAGSFIMTLPTTGFKEVKLKYAVFRTAQGAQSNILSYTTDGVNYVSAGLSTATNPVTESYTLVTYDFSTITAANNNPNFKIKVDFGTGGSNASGNNRFDNISLEGKKL